MVWFGVRKLLLDLVHSHERLRENGEREGMPVLRIPSLAQRPRTRGTVSLTCLISSEQNSAGPTPAIRSSFGFWRKRWGSGLQ